MFKEDFLQFIWKLGLFRSGHLKTSRGETIEVLEPGEQNFHAGPDFFNARIRMGPLEWAGNVEVHMLASDWIKHGHHLDPAYDNVILHVVGSMDCDTLNSKGRPIQTLALDFHEGTISRYESLQSAQNWLPCNLDFAKIPAPLVQGWFRQLQRERLMLKSGRIATLMEQHGMRQEESFYLAMAHGFGLPINTLPFELLSSLAPMQLLAEHRDNIPVLEAILYGQSGFLHAGMIQGPYSSGLMELYRERRASLKGKSLERHLWKFLRLRPVSFPTIRISQFASLIHHHFPLADSLLSFTTISEIEQFLRVRTSEYWDTHYVFGKCSPYSEKFMGHQSILTMIINVIVPFLHASGKGPGRSGRVHHARKILFELEAETNQILKNWINFGIRPVNAFESQALIQLYNGYCKQKRCLDCQIGAYIIESGFHEEQ